MSESTDVNGEQSAAPRRSRREQRQVERAAEREAYLTGQQPLLTRREMRRLREEAEALREAIAAGEITEEEARALQDPTYEGENLSVLAGVVPGEEPVVTAEQDDEDDDGDLGHGVLRLGDPEDGERATGGATDDGAAELDRPTVRDWGGYDGAQTGAPAVAEPSGYGGAEPSGLTVPELPDPVRPQPVGYVVPDLVAPQAPAPYRTDAFSAQAAHPGPDSRPARDSWFDDDAQPAEQQGAEGYSADEVTAIAAMETGVLNAAELAAIDDERSADPGGVEAPAVVPERRSLFEAASQQATWDAPQVLDRADDAEWAPATALPAASSPAGSAGGGYALSADDLVSPYGPASADGDERGAQEVPASPPSPSAPARRPIVRIPSTVQGVRTVDRGTGELSSVQPVDDDFSGIDNPQWKALRDTDSTDAAGDDAPDVDEAPVSAPTPEEPETHVVDAVEDDDEVDEHVEHLTAPVVEERRGGGARRALLIALVVLVVLLVLATIVWFVLVRGGNVFAVSALLESFTPLII